MLKKYGIPKLNNILIILFIQIILFRREKLTSKSQIMLDSCTNSSCEQISDEMYFGHLSEI